MLFNSITMGTDKKGLSYFANENQSSRINKESDLYGAFLFS